MINPAEINKNDENKSLMSGMEGAPCVFQLKKDDRENETAFRQSTEKGNRTMRNKATR